MFNRLKKAVPERHPLRLLWHRGKAATAALVMGFPARSIVVIGITGTDGKTTTVGMTTHILRSAGIPTGALSTAYFQERSHVRWNATQKTSPSPFAIQRFLRNLVTQRCTHAVLEVSSHGLVQGRHAFTWPQVAAITNTSMEHLDYHGSMGQYRRDKGMLFRMLHDRGTKVLNRDDETYEMYRAIPSQRTITYGRRAPEEGSIGETTLWISDVEATPTGCSATLHLLPYPLSPTPYPLMLSIPGTFNLENALCAFACALACGVQPEKSLAALRTFRGVPGRLERIDEGQPFTVIIDFTVTPMAYKRTLEALRQMLPSGKRLLVLTGSCGDRMREKRPIVGKICSHLGDIVVVTNEDPYTEDPQKIIDEVWAGVDQHATEAYRIFDRKQAIAFLLARAQPGDIVILCAKGSDTTMWTAEGQIPWNEREMARELLRELSPKWMRVRA